MSELENKLLTEIKDHTLKEAVEESFSAILKDTAYLIKTLNGLINIRASGFTDHRYETQFDNDCNLEVIIRLKDKR